MESTNNLGTTLLKSIGYATTLFWTLISSERFNEEMIPFIFLSIIPISIVCSLTILITVFPFFLFEKGRITKDKIFKKYFPYYSMIAFGISAYYIFCTNIEYFICAFFITAFITLMQSWIWMSRINSK